MTDPIYGYDISNHQGHFNHEGAYSEGFRFCMAKSSEGATYIDPYFRVNKKAARAAGLLFAAYHFVRESNPAAQARNVDRAVGDKSCPVFLDSERGSLNELQNFHVAQEIRKLGYRVIGNYFAHFWWVECGRPTLRVGPLWATPSADIYVAGTGSASTLYEKIRPAWWDGYGGQPVAFLQFTDKARIAGSSVDASAFRGTMAELHAVWGGAAPVPTPAPKIAVGAPTLGTVRTGYGEWGPSWSWNRGKDPSHPNWGQHTGEDWHRNAGGAEIGDPIVAIASGKVIYAGDARSTGAGWGSAFGKHVLIKWDRGGRTSIDAHMSDVAVRDGQHVRAGQKIGEKGMTGNVSGPHDHHEQHLGTKWTSKRVKPVYPKPTAVPAGSFRVGAGPRKGHVYKTPGTISVKWINDRRKSGKFSRHVWWLQHWLNMAGYKYGTSTGYWDPKTQKLYNQFRVDAGYRDSDTHGAVGIRSLAKLRAKAHASKNVS
jgi:murein DD-endopeptidase MepM/ murein hydrolase activator NlpD